MSPGTGVRVRVPGAAAYHVSGRGEAGGGGQDAVCRRGGQGKDCILKVSTKFRESFNNNPLLEFMKQRSLMHYPILYAPCQLTLGTGVSVGTSLNV